MIHLREELQRFAAREAWEHDFANGEFFKMSMRCDVVFQKKMTIRESESQESSHRKLVAEIPDNILIPHSANTAIADMINTHQGEIREISGEWHGHQCGAGR